MFPHRCYSSSKTRKSLFMKFPRISVGSRDNVRGVTLRRVASSLFVTTTGKKKKKKKRKRISCGFRNLRNTNAIREGHFTDVPRKNRKITRLEVVLKMLGRLCNGLNDTRGVGERGEQSGYSPVPFKPPR